ncbi:hypothetical protein [Pseudomonas phage HU1]|nr:hypothetical protein [Pseudomonas phage HU1]
MNDKKSDRLGTMVFTIANELVNHFGKKLDRPVIDDITRNLTLEMCSGPTAWAFSGKDEPGQPIYDEAKERELFEAFAVNRRGGYGNLPFFVFARKDNGQYTDGTAELAWEGWKACAQSLAKAGENE